MSKDAAPAATAKGNQPSHQTGRANCDHCADWCSGCAMLYPGMEPHSNAYVQWAPGHCPYCAERERIAAIFDERAAAAAATRDKLARMELWFESSVHESLMLREQENAKIARGER